MKKSLYIIVLTLCFVLAFIGKSYGRDIKIDWQNCYGGSFNDFGKKIIQTYDGGYIFIADAFSKDGDIGGNFSNPAAYDPNIWIVKINSRGDIEWKQIFDFNYGFEESHSIIQCKDSNYVILGVEGQGSGQMNQVVIKLNPNGIVLWNKRIILNAWSLASAGLYENNDNDIIFFTRDTASIIYKIDKNGGVLKRKIFKSNEKIVKLIPTLGNSYTLISSNSSDSLIINVTKYDSSDNVISDIRPLGLPSVNSSVIDCTIDNDDGIYILANTYISVQGEYKSILYKCNNLGIVEWIKEFRNYVTNNGSMALSKNNKSIVFDFYATEDQGDIIIAKIDLVGNLIALDSLGSSLNDLIGNISECRDGGYIVMGTMVKKDRDITCFKGAATPWVAKIFFNPNYITGNIFIDNNNNCIQNANERGIPNYSLKASNNLYTSFNTSQTNGKYYLTVADTGLYNIELLPNSSYPYYSVSNCNSYSVHLRDSIDTANFAFKPSILCPINTVNVSTTTPFRIGRPQTYSVNYCNNGTILSLNTYITIKLDSLLDFNSSTIPYTILPNHTYHFNIGNLDYLTCGNFSFVATPRIGAVQLHQTLCTEAHIYPDTICTTPNYTGSYIVASAQCLGDSVELKLENRGGDMQVRKRYIVIEDQVMRINHDYQLPRNGTVIEKMPADFGRTYRIIAEQEDNLPLSYGDKFATAAIEACRQSSADNFSTDYFTQFPNYDGEPFRAMSCNVITSSYDPNDKVASPVGYTAQHYIEKNTQIDYQINFQNTGNDTAFKVVIVDTISPTLDINSIQLGVASHTYQFQRTDSNVVQFVFDNILLVDSFRNEAKSHGFIKFKIQQKLNNANGTKIYNKADIYFDYNAPIITNQTYHTVGQNFVTVNLITAIKNPKYNVKEVKVFPNPFRDKTQIIVEAEQLKNPVLLLMNIEGKVIKTILSNNNNTFDIYREDLTNGLYLFKIMQDKEEVANGKVVVQ